MAQIQLTPQQAQEYLRKNQDAQIVSGHEFLPQEFQPKQPSFLESILGGLAHGIVDPFSNLAAGTGELANKLVNGPDSNNMFLSRNETDHPLDFALKTGAGLGSLAAGGLGGGTLAGAVGSGALSGGLGAFANQKVGSDFDLGNILSSAALGGGIGGALHGVMGAVKGAGNVEAGTANAENQAARYQKLFETPDSELGKLDLAQKSAIRNQYMDMGLKYDPKASLSQIYSQLDNQIAKLEPARLAAGLERTPEGMGQLFGQAGKDIGSFTDTMAPTNFTRNDLIDSAMEHIKSLHENTGIQQKAQASLNDFLDSTLQDTLATEGQPLNVTALQEAKTKLYPFKRAYENAMRGENAASMLNPNSAPIVAKAKLYDEISNAIKGTADAGYQDATQLYAIGKNQQKNLVGALNQTENSAGNVLTKRGLLNKVSKSVMGAKDTGTEALVNMLKGNTQLTGPVAEALANSPLANQSVQGLLARQLGMQPQAQPNMTSSDQTNSSGMLAGLDDNSQALEESRQFAQQMLAKGAKAGDISRALTLAGRPDPFAKVSATQRMKLVDIKDSVGNIDSLINDIRGNGVQFGRVGGGPLGEVLGNVIDPAKRANLKKALSTVSAEVSRITGNKNLTDQLSMLQDPDSLIANLRDIQAKMVQAYQDRSGAAASGNGPSLGLALSQ